MGTNYGGILQNYALQQVLRKLGHKPITMNVVKCTPRWYRWASTLKRTIFKKSHEESPYQERKRLKRWRGFVENNISKTPLLRKYREKDIRRFQIDAIVVGSDQVWRPIYNVNVEDMFCGFLSDRRIPRLTYAASFGASEWEFSEEQTERCSHLLRNFCRVSVREENGVPLCEKYFNRETQVVLDPTLLLRREHYESLCSDIPQESFNFLFAYILDLTEEKLTFVNRIAREKGLKVIVTSKEVSSEDCPEMWLSHFRDAKFVVTDSFHGTVFSLLFHQPFLSIQNKQRGNARFDTLSSLFCIDQQIVGDEELVSKDISSIAIPNWEYIDNVLGEKRKSSMGFLEEGLDMMNKT